MAKVLGCVKDVPVSYGSMVVPLYFLVVLNVTFEVIFGSPTPAAMQACLNYRRQQVSVIVVAKQFSISSLSEPPAFDEARADIEEFTSEEGSGDEHFVSSTESNGSDEGSDTEYDLLFAILNK